MTWLLAIAAQSLALGYAAGRLRPLQRLGRWVDGYSEPTTGANHAAPAWIAEPYLVLALAAAYVMHPLRTHRMFHQVPDERAAAPEIDPEWGRQ